MSSLKRLAIKGAVWTLVAYGLGQVIRLGSSMLLTRLLVPQVFGLFSLVTTLIVGLHLFTDIGLGPSVVQNKRGDDPDFLNTVWTIQVLRSIGIWVACALAAWPTSLFYGESRLTYLIPIVALTTIINGFNSTSLLTLDRRMHRGLATIYGLAQQIISTGTTLIWAWFNPTLWAIVAGGMVSAIVSVVWSHFLLPGKGNRFHWDRSAAHEIVHFGKWIFLSTAITFFAEQIDKIMLGKMFPLAVLGVYGVALTLADVPRSVTLAISGKIIFPALSKFTDLPRPELRDKILRNRWPILLAFAGLMTIPICWGDRIVMLLYRPAFWDAAWMLPILCLGIWPRVLCNTNESALFALGQSRYPAMAQMTRFVFTAAGVALGYRFWGLTGVVIAVALNDLPFYAVINWALWKEGLNGLRQDLLYTLLLIVLTAAMLGLRYAMGFGFPIDRLLH